MLKTVEKFEELSTEQKNECKKAYIYVKNSDIPEYLDKKISKEEKEIIENYKVVYTEKDEYGYEIRDYDYEYLSMYNTYTTIDVEGYRKLYRAVDEYRYDEEIDINNYEVKAHDDNIKVTVDLENFIKQMYEAEKNNTKESKVEEIRYLKTSDENVVFYITTFSVSYESYRNKLEHVSFEGYLLVK